MHWRHPRPAIPQSIADAHPRDCGSFLKGGVRRVALARDMTIDDLEEGLPTTCADIDTVVDVVESLTVELEGKLDAAYAPKLSTLGVHPRFREAHRGST